MRYYAPAIVVCLLGVALMLGAGLAWATTAPSRGGRAVETRKAPLLAMQERGSVTLAHGAANDLAAQPPTP